VYDLGSASWAFALATVNTVVTIPSATQSESRVGMAGHTAGQAVKHGYRGREMRTQTTEPTKLPGIDARQAMFAGGVSA